MSTRRVAIVFGGASGIGAAVAQGLAADGMTVAVVDLSCDAGRAVAGKCGGAHAAYAADVSDELQVGRVFDAVEHDLGAVAVTVVAAGTPGLVEGKRPTLRATSVDLWEHVMAINARGPFLCVREMLGRQEKSPVKDGRIILIASMAAQGLAINSPAAYVASKGAVLALTKVAAGEGAKLGVTVNAVAPGAIDTPMLRSVMPPDRDASYFANSVPGRAGSPSEVAQAIRFLASPEASYINGACIDVNGGFAMR